MSPDFEHSPDSIESQLNFLERHPDKIASIIVTTVQVWAGAVRLAREVPSHVRSLRTGLREAGVLLQELSDPRQPAHLADPWEE